MHRKLVQVRVLRFDDTVRLFDPGFGEFARHCEQRIWCMIGTKLCHLVDFFHSHVACSIKRWRTVDINKVLRKQTRDCVLFLWFNLGDGDKADPAEGLAPHPAVRKSLSGFADKIGLAFQIEDDILDETSTDEILGKHAGADAAHHKMTYPAVHGMEAAREKVRVLTAEAIAALDMLSRNTSSLRAIAEFLVGRKY